MISPSAVLLMRMNSVLVLAGTEIRSDVTFVSEIVWFQPLITTAFVMVLFARTRQMICLAVALKTMHRPLSFCHLQPDALSVDVGMTLVAFCAETLKDANARARRIIFIFRRSKVLLRKRH